jgi:hypothetical protein
MSDLMYILRKRSERVVDFLRDLPPQLDGGIIKVDLVLPKESEKRILEGTTEILLDNDGQRFEDGLPLHPLVSEYPCSVSVFGLGKGGYGRIAHCPSDISKPYGLNETRPLLPIFLFNGVPESIYSRMLNPLVGLARVGYVVEGFSIADAVDERGMGLVDGGVKPERFRQGMVSVADSVLSYGSLATVSDAWGNLLSEPERRWAQEYIEKVAAAVEMLQQDIF